MNDYKFINFLLETVYKQNKANVSIKYQSNHRNIIISLIPLVYFIHPKICYKPLYEKIEHKVAERKCRLMHLCALLLFPYEPLFYIFPYKSSMNKCFTYSQQVWQK